MASSSYRAKVVIVGAGASGMAAGTRLLARGFSDFVILESEFRIGGRIQTVKFDDITVDLGAQYCHGQLGNVVYEMANAFLLLESSVKWSNMFYALSSGQMLDYQVGEKLLSACVNIVEEAKKHPAGPSESLGDFMTHHFQKYIQTEDNKDLCWNFLDWFQRFENAIDGSDSWFNTSLKGNNEYKDCEGNPTLNWKTVGYSRIFDIMMKKFPNPALLIPVEPRVHVGKEVYRIEWDRGQHEPATIYCSDGSKYLAEKVLVTVSLGALKERHLRLFNPQLPQQKQIAIKGLAFGTVNKILLKFSEVWWPQNIAGFSFIWTKSDAAVFKKTYANNDRKRWLLDLFGIYQYYGQRNVMCGWVVGDSARLMEKCSDSEVQAGCQELLQRFLGGSYQIPPIQSILRSNWYSNENFKGSYSYRDLNSEQLEASASQLAAPVVNSRGEEELLFAGEATHEHYFSTVHGAIETGWREADRILTYFSNVQQ
ncbi:hypothetical protein ONE63_002887 [Megalurothrips usitatus]|uniref:Amine oxidase domain-containing protein n=1 Tax=Megalurothrips usitatus TaxID=439358 RepID=A0AAV7XA09_9NEOP|nr:hypothetical protein ONE63_002887 [Megalurothrips usitatus]